MISKLKVLIWEFQLWIKVFDVAFEMRSKMGESDLIPVGYSLARMELDDEPRLKYVCKLTRSPVWDKLVSYYSWLCIVGLVW